MAIQDNTAVLIIMPRENPGALDDPGRWKKGEIIQVVRADSRLGWNDVPANYLGDFTVEQINARPAGNNTVHETMGVTNDGTLTVGSQTTDVVAGDVIAWQYPGYWRNFGQLQHYPPYNRVLVYVDDKTAQEMTVYMEQYNLKISMQTIAGPDPEGLRRIRVGNLRASISGLLEFTQEGADNTVEEWNALYPESELTIISFDPLEVVYQGKFTDGQRGDFEDILVSNAGQEFGHQRRWYIPESEVDQLLAADGWRAGPSSSLTFIDRMLE